MNAEDALIRLGGVASSEQLRAVVKRRAIERALKSGEIKRVRKGMYVLASVDRHRATAHRLNGVLSHLSAAQAHGWKVKSSPDVPWVTVPRTRNVRPSARAEVARSDLEPWEIQGDVTAPLRTVIDCARRLGFDEALAVADSALRSGLVDHDELLAAAQACRGAGSRAVRRVAEHASSLAANPFESVLRSLALEQLDVLPQVPVHTAIWVFHPDLVDEGRRIVVEAESFEWHGSREQYRRDVERYTLLTAAGWIVLRFTWEQVMLQPEFVRSRIRETLACNRTAG